MSGTLELADGSRLALDADGCLEDWTGWTREVAERMAAADGVQLGSAHWRVIEVLREYYEAYEIAPPMRALVRLLHERDEGDGYGSRELYRLFPEGPAKQACRYAGLPRPVSCI